MTPKEKGISYDTKTLIVVLTLFIVYPAGIVLMLLWMKWRWWIKLLIGLPIFIFPLILFGILFFIGLSTVNTRAQMQKANCAKQCQLGSEMVKAEMKVSFLQACIQDCTNVSLPTPSTEEIK